MVPCLNVVLVVVVVCPVGDTVLRVSFSLKGMPSVRGISAPSMKRNWNEKTKINRSIVERHKYFISHFFKNNNWKMEYHKEHFRVLFCFFIGYYKWKKELRKIKWLYYILDKGFLHPKFNSLKLSMKEISLSTHELMYL